MTGQGAIEDLRRRYAELPDDALLEAHACGEGNYRPEAWHVIVAELAARRLTVPSRESQPPTPGPGGPPLTQRFFDARWPLYLNSVFVILAVWASSHFSLVHTPSASLRLLQLAALLSVAGLFLLGTWRRSLVVEGLVAAVYGYLAVLRIRSGIGSRPPGSAIAEPTSRAVFLAAYWAGSVALVGLCAYFAGRFVRRARSLRR